jgi:hypothetical protein
MSWRNKVMLAALVVVIVITGFILNGHSIPGSVTAAEGLTASTQRQLKQKLMKKRQLLEQEVDAHKIAIEMGRGSQSSLKQAREAVMRVDIELSDSKEERAKIYAEIIQFYAEREKSLELQVQAGQRPMFSFREAQLDRLDVEIEMLKDQLN